MKSEEKYLRRLSESLRGECRAEKVMERSEDEGAGDRLLDIVSGAVPCGIRTGYFVFHQFL